MRSGFPPTASYPAGRPPNEVRRSHASFHYRKLDEAAPGRRQGRMASGRTLSVCRLNRDQHGSARRKCRRLLQSPTAVSSRCQEFLRSASRPDLGGAAKILARAAFTRAMESMPSFRSLMYAYVQAFLEQVGYPFRQPSFGSFRRSDGMHPRIPAFHLSAHNPRRIVHRSRRIRDK